MGHANVAAVSTTPTRVYAARLVGLPIFDPQGDQVGKVRDLVVALRSEAQPAARARAGRRGVRPAPDLRADDPGHQHRQRAGLHDRAAQHAPLRAAPDRDPGDGPDARPHRHHQAVRRGVHRHRLRRRAWSRPATATGCCQPGRRAGAAPRASAAAARPTSSSGATSTGLTRREETQGATHLIAAAQRDAPGRRGQRHPRPAAGAAYRGGRRARRRAARRRPRGAARGGPGRDPRAPRLRARRRRPRGDVARRRRRPDRRPAARDRRHAARADGARRGRGRPPADVLRREHRRRR